MAATTTAAASTAREGRVEAGLRHPGYVYTQPIGALCRLTTDRGRVVQIQKHGKGNYQVQAARGGCWEAAGTVVASVGVLVAVVSVVAGDAHGPIAEEADAHRFLEDGAASKKGASANRAPRPT